jgi:hypothetical protein
MSDDPVPMRGTLVFDPDGTFFAHFNRAGSFVAPTGYSQKLYPKWKDNMKCILNVSTHEHDAILQLNHDSLVLNSQDHHLMTALEGMLGSETADEIRRYDECRVQKQDSLAELPRVEAINETKDPSANEDTTKRPFETLSGSGPRREVAGCPTGLSDALRP